MAANKNEIPTAKEYSTFRKNLTSGDLINELETILKYNTPNDNKIQVYIGTHSSIGKNIDKAIKILQSKGYSAYITTENITVKTITTPSKYVLGIIPWGFEKKVQIDQQVMMYLTINIE